MSIFKITREKLIKKKWNTVIYVTVNISERWIILFYTCLFKFTFLSLLLFLTMNNKIQ